MKDDEFEALLKYAAHSWRRPPELKDPEATWRAIEGALPAAEAEAAGPRLARETTASPPTRARTWTRPWTHPWARLAAMLLAGVAIGRATAGRDARVADRQPAPAPAVAHGGATPEGTPASPDQAAAGEYLARTQALLAGLPTELYARGPRTGDAAFLSRADALLLETRLLLDSPLAADPTLRALLDDLEIVLAQVVRLDARRDSMEVDFLHQALEQRDVLPRLRDAVADAAVDHAAD